MNGKVLYFLDCVKNKDEFRNFLRTVEVVPTPNRHWDIFDVYCSISGLGEPSDPMIQQFDKVRDYLLYSAWELSFVNEEDYLISVMKFPDAIHFRHTPSVFTYFHNFSGLPQHLGKQLTVHFEISKYTPAKKFEL